VKNYTDEELNGMSNAQLEKIASGQDINPPPQTDYTNAELEKMSDEELAKIAGRPLSDFGLDKPKKELNTPAKLGVAAAQGFLNMGVIPGNLVARGINAVAGKNIAPLSNLNIKEELGYGKDQGLAEKATQIGAEIAFPLGPGAKIGSKLIDVGGKILPAFLKNSQRTKNVADILGVGALLGAGNAASDQDASIGRGAAWGATAGALGATAAKGVAKAFPVLMKYLPFKATNSPEKMDEILKATEGLPVDIGSITGNNKAREAYVNKMSKTPLSGVPEKMEQVVNATDRKAKNFISRITEEGISTNYNEEIKKELIDTLAKNEEKVSNAYTEVSNAADKYNIPFVSDNLKKTAQQELKKIKAAVKSGRLSEAGLNGEVLSTIKKLANPKRTQKSAASPLVGSSPEAQRAIEEMSAKSKEAIPGTLSLVDDERKVLSRMASQHLLDKNKNLHSIYSKLANAAQKDIEETISKSEVPQLNKMLKDARKLHADTVIPYRHTSIYDIIKNEKPSDILHNRLLTPDNKVVYQKLSTSSKNKALFNYLMDKARFDEEGKLQANPTRIVEQSRSLGEMGRARVFSKEQQDALKNLTILNEIAKNYRPALKRPQTGVQSIDYLAKVPNIVGAGLGEAIDDGRHPVVAGTLGALIPSLITRGRAARMTSPAMKKLYKEQKSSSKRKDKLALTLTRLLTAK
jgi:hypothetical protein